MIKKLSLIFTLIVIYVSGNAQNDSLKHEKVKKGFSFGAVPVVAYDSDLGLKYGGVVNLYHFGDGSRYPEYDHSLYLEWTRTTKGNGINQIVYDSEQLIPNMRVNAEVSYMTEKALHFYGFNGYRALYNKDFEVQDSPEYISRMFYRHDRRSLRLRADFQGNIGSDKLRWLAGITYHGTKVDSIDLNNLNKGKSGDDILPNVPALYDYYKQWGVINKSEAKGGDNTMFKFGLMYDTRDIEANPSKGLWEEVVFFVGPDFMGYENFTVSALFLHRQYFTILPNTLTFAYRMGYQTRLAGTVPFYLLPYFSDSKRISDGFGGSKTVRGILRNRIVGDGVGFGNFEFRYKVLKTSLFKQNFYIALSTFADVARVIDPYSVDLSNVPSALDIGGNTYNPQEWFNYQDESFHLAFGGGVRFALNQNFIVAVDYGMAAKKEDGERGLYINLNWLF